MAEIKEISDARRRRNAKRNVKKLIFFLAVIVIFLSAVFIKQNVSKENILAVFSDFFGGIGGGQEYPIYVPGSATKSLISNGSGAGVITETQFITYNKSGKEMGKWVHGFNNPTVKRVSNKFLVFDRGGTGVKVYSKTRLLWNNTCEETVFGGTISGRYIALTTASQTYSCEVLVYNTSYKELMKWYCADGRVTDILFHDASGTMYVAVARAENGVYYTDIYSISIKEKKEKAVVSLRDILGVALIKEGSDIAVVGDGRTEIINSSLQNEGTYNYGGKTLSGVGTNKSGELILALSDNDNGRGTDVCLIGKNGTEKGCITVSGEIKSVDGYKNKIICLYGDEVMIYDIKSKESKTVKTDIDVYDISAGSDGIYLLSVSGINRIKY